MMDNLEEDFHSTLEPMVIINAQDDEENANILNNMPTESPQGLLPNDGSTAGHIGPEISIFPVKKKPRPHYKIRLFKTEYSSSREEEDTSRTIQRTPVRLISKQEALTTEDTYAKRKSSPLEKCPICKKYFRRMKTHLLKHEILEKGDTERLTCGICSKIFNNQTNLQIHMRVHTGDKPYICEVCDKSFSQSCNLVNHLRIHTGERPFKCPHCDRAFTQSGNLNNHIRLHTDEKPFKCHFCPKAFVQSGNLNSHIRNNHKYDTGFVSSLPVHSQ